MTSHALRVVLVIGIVIFFWMLMTSSQRSGDGFTTVGVGRGGPCDPSNPTAQCSPGGACSQLELCDLGQGCFSRRGDGCSGNLCVKDDNYCYRRLDDVFPPPGSLGTKVCDQSPSNYLRCKPVTLGEHLPLRWECVEPVQCQHSQSF